MREETGMVLDPGTCVFIIETVRPYSARLIDLVFLSRTSPAGQPRCQEDGLTPVFVPLTELGMMRLHPPVAKHLNDVHSHRDGPIAAIYLRHEWTTPGPPARSPCPQPARP
jgi:hypothetical protein